MRKPSPELLPAMIAIVCALVASAACMDREPAPVCPVPTELVARHWRSNSWHGVDIAVVVDNSGSMAEEQAILSTAFFPLVNSLTNPLPGWGYPAADDVRIAVISSDMGLQWGGNPYEPGDGWPDDAIPCSPAGDDGQFQTYGPGQTIDIQHAAIPCDASAAQCPTGWSCSATAPDEVGTCQAPDGVGDDQQCPELTHPWSEIATWAETAYWEENSELAFQVACLSSLGTDGCGFEQQLQAAAKGLHRDDQEIFVRVDALLAVLVVSDEEDCSLEDGPSLFASPEIQDYGAGRVNIACGENQEALYEMEDFRQAFVAAKGGDEDAVVFAAIVGVPPGSECEGTGDELEGCLDNEYMYNLPVVEDGNWFYRPACTREEGGEEVTRARPGRRYVELAQQFRSMGYVYSICNADWSPAMAEVAELIASQMGNTCFEKPLTWDPVTRTANCDLVAEYIDEEACPAEFGEVEPLTEVWTDADDVEHESLFCPLPRLPVPRSCDALEAVPSELGWYYCENFGHAAENFDEVCEDGLDNDGNGTTDCEDAACQACRTCGGDGVGCENTCRYVMQLTKPARDAVAGQLLSVQCLQQFEFTDDNCREDTAMACNDERDNDGNGVYDCDVGGVELPHDPDPTCCPLTMDANKSCVLDDAVFDNCPGSTPADPPDACAAAAAALGCQLDG
jgi:hypothetical protein